MVAWECPTKPREASGLDPEAVHAVSSQNGTKEYRNFPWFNSLKDRLKSSDELIEALNPGSTGPTVAHVYVGPQNPFELYYVEVTNSAFKKDTGRTLNTMNDLATVDTPNNFGRSES